MSTQENLTPVIKVVLAQMSDTHGMSDIETHETLQELGLRDDSTIAEVKTRIYRSISGNKNKLDFAKFYEKAVISLNSTVGQVIKSVMAALPGNDPTKPI